MTQMTDIERTPYLRFAGAERAAPPGHVTVAARGDELLRRFAAVVGDWDEGVGGLAAAMGAALAGRRATAFVSGREMGSAGELVARAASLRLPLIVHLTLDADSPRGADAALHEASAAGAVVLAASNLQEALDLALIGRRVAEAALVPVVVAADECETLAALQDVAVPGTGLVRTWLGDAEATVHAGTPAEEAIFGRHRRRVPRWHDAAHPLLVGAALGAEAAAAEATARRIFFDPRAGNELSTAFEAFAELAGRRYGALSQHRLRSSRLVLVTSGAAVELASVVADALAEEGLRVGVVGLRCVEPFPAADLVPLLEGRARVVVVERIAGSASGEPPLTGAVVESLGRAAVVRGRRGDGDPTLAPRRVPAVGSALWGLGGAARRADDLAELCRRSLAERDTLSSTVTVGVEPLPNRSALPKRRVLFDGLRRDYPEAPAAGVRGGRSSSPPRGVTMEAYGERAGHLVRAAGEVLFEAAGGRVRSRLEGPAAVLAWSQQPLGDPGDEPPVQILVADPDALRRSRLAQADPGATLLLPRGAHGLSPESRRLVLERGLELRSPANVEESAEEDVLLGAVVSLLAARAGMERRALVAARRRLLEARDDAAVEEHLSAFEVGWDGLRKVEDIDTEAVATGVAAPTTLPLADAADAAPVASLARFWDQVGILATESGDEELGADPCLVAGSVPALADGLRDVSAERRVLPRFDPALCTGCGACWSLCPHGAVAPLVSTPAGLVEVGMARAQESGATVDALRPLLSKLGTGFRKEVSDGFEGGPAGEPLRAAFASVMESSSFSGERREAIDDAFAAVCAALDDLPVARTAPLFDSAEAQKRGSGTLLSVALSPRFCKGCAVCIAVCEPEALESEPDDPTRRDVEQARWRLAAAAPAASAEVVARLRASAEVGPLAATLLTSAARRIMSGGDGAAAGEGAAIVLRQTLGVLAAHLEPAQDARRQTLDEARQSLARAIHEALASALPEDDLGALARGLEAVALPDVDLGALTSRVEGALEGRRVDVPRLRELVEVARRLTDLARDETEGRRRAGASFSLVLGPGAPLAWASSFPHAPFAVPAVADDTGETVALARGLFQAARASAVAEARLLRGARRLAEGGTPGRDERELRWEDLDPDERQACPPLVLALAESAFAATGLGSLLEVLAGDLPILVLLLSEANLVVDGPASLDWETLLVSLPRPFVAQCSPAAPNHLERCLAEALEADAPAVVRLHAPSPARHGFAVDGAPSRAEEAILTRVFPLLRRPASRGEALPLLDLTSNPDVADSWSGGRTPAHWALGESRFAGELRPLTDDEATAAVPIVELLSHDPAERADKTAVLDDEAGGRWRIGSRLLRATERRARIWAALRNLASLTEVEAERRAGRTAPELEERHRLETERLRSEYEERIAGLRSTVQGELVQRLRSRLLTLATRRRQTSVESGVRSNGENGAVADEGGGS